MAEYTALSWKMVNPNPRSSGIRSSRYIIIDRLAINVELPSSGPARAVATLHEDHDGARDMALGTWMPADEKLGLILDGEVTATSVDSDLDNLAKAYVFWDRMTPDLAQIIERINATGVPL